MANGKSGSSGAAASACWYRAIASAYAPSSIRPSACETSAIWRRTSSSGCRKSRYTATRPPKASTVTAAIHPTFLRRRPRSAATRWSRYHHQRGRVASTSARRASHSPASVRATIAPLLRIMLWIVSMRTRSARRSTCRASKCAITSSIRSRRRSSPSTCCRPAPGRSAATASSAWWISFRSTSGEVRVPPTGTSVSSCAASTPARPPLRPRAPGPLPGTRHRSGRSPP